MRVVCAIAPLIQDREGIQAPCEEALKRGALDSSSGSRGSRGRIALRPRSVWTARWLSGTMDVLPLPIFGGLEQGPEA